jgi:hypothetical protein
VDIDTQPLTFSDRISTSAVNVLQHQLLFGSRITRIIQHCGLSGRCKQNEGNRKRSQCQNNECKGSNGPMFQRQAPGSTPFEIHCAELLAEDGSLQRPVFTSSSNRPSSHHSECNSHCFDNCQNDTLLCELVCAHMTR